VFSVGQGRSTEIYDITKESQNQNQNEIYRNMKKRNLQFCQLLSNAFICRNLVKTITPNELLFNDHL